MKIIHFADLHLGMENYGRLDPATGLSSRLLDFLSALDQLVDYALETGVDLVVFCGDAYKSREPTQTQQREFAKRINRLASGGIPIFLLIGNHDLPNAAGRATATEIFNTLTLENVYVSGSPEICTIPTKSGEVQIASLPWLRRSALLTREDTRNMSFEQLTQKMQQILTGIISRQASGLDPALPSILAAHVWVTGARVGSESMMTIGQEHALLLSNIANPAFDYIALGHIHKRQVLSQDPPVAYSGSLERVDFGEEDDDKGFYIVEIETDEQTGKRHVSFDFHPVAGRRFLTINVNIEPEDTDPNTTVLTAAASHEAQVKDAIVRLVISLPAGMEGQLRDSEIRNAFKEAYYFTISRDIIREVTLRLGNWAAEEITPVEALKKWVETQKFSPERAETLLKYGEELIKERQGGHSHN